MASSPTVLAGQDLTALLVGVPAWTAMSLLNGWANTGGGNVSAQYRTWPLLNSVEVIGTINAGTLTNGTNIATGLPVAASSQFVIVMVTTSTGAVAVTTPRLFVDTSGDLQVFSIPASTTTISFHGW